MTAPKTITVADAKRFALASAILPKEERTDSMFRYAWLEPFGGTFATNGYALVLALDTHDPFDGPAVGVRMDKRVAKNFKSLSFDLEAGVARYADGKLSALSVAPSSVTPPPYGLILPERLVTVVTDEMGVGYRNCHSVLEVTEWFGEAMPTFRFGRGRDGKLLHVLATDAMDVPAIVCSTLVTRSFDKTVATERWDSHDAATLARFAETGGKLDVSELHYGERAGGQGPTADSPVNIFQEQLRRWNGWRREQKLDTVEAWRGVEAPLPLPAPAETPVASVDDWFTEAVAR